MGRKAKIVWFRQHRCRLLIPRSGSFLTGADDRLIHDFFRRWIPVESLAAAVRLRGHDYDNGGENP